MQLYLECSSKRFNIQFTHAIAELDMLSEESYKDSTCAFLGRTPTCRDRAPLPHHLKNSHSVWQVVVRAIWCACGHGALVAATLSLLFNVVEPKSCVYVCYVD
jgi:hypothetical protein